MSAASQVAWQNLSGARRKLQRIADGLRLAAGGEAVRKTAEQVRSLVDRIAVDKYAKHMRSGALRASVEATASGGLVQLQRLAYARYHKWDPFRRGGLPPFIVKQAQRIFSATLLGVVRNDPDFVRSAASIGLSEAEDVEVETRNAAAKSDAKRAEKQRQCEERVRNRPARGRRR